MAAINKYLSATVMVVALVGGSAQAAFLPVCQRTAPVKKVF